MAETARLEDMKVCPTCGCLAVPEAHQKYHRKLSGILKAIVAKTDPLGQGWMPR